MKMFTHAKPSEEFKCTSHVTSTHAQWQPVGVNGDFGPPALSHAVAGSRGGRGASVRAGMGRRSSHMARSMRKRLAARMLAELRQSGHGANGALATSHASILMATVG